ncbi:MAG: hypothetical protein ACKPGK_16390 [Verrucomicrobiota bacterium]
MLASLPVPAQETTAAAAATAAIAPADSIEWGFQRMDEDIRWLSGALAEVLAALGEPELARWVPWRPGAPGVDDAGAEPPPRLGLALALAFKLLNNVEERV